MANSQFQLTFSFIKWIVLFCILFGILIYHTIWPITSGFVPLALISQLKGLILYRILYFSIPLFFVIIISSFLISRNIFAKNQLNTYSERNSSMSCSINPNKLLKSAVHLYPDDFERDLYERLKHPFKSSAPEYGVDLSLIHKELVSANKSRLNKSIFNIIITVISFIIFLQNIEDNWWIFILTFSLLSLIEFLHLRSVKRKVRKILTTQDLHNTNNTSKNINIIISGGFSPFIGSGINLENWSFTVDLSVPEDNEKVIEKISLIELHEYIKERLCLINIEDISISNELLVRGENINSLSQFFQNGKMTKPIDHIDNQYLIDKIGKNDKDERHYKVIRIPMWNDQLLLSMYYRFLIVNKNLFCEAKFFILHPLKDKYLQINNIPTQTTYNETIDTLRKALGTATFSWLFDILWLLAFVSGGFMSKRLQLKAWKKEVETNRLYNYGWNNSLREKWSSISYKNYFQQADKDISQKLLTNEFLSGLMAYLSEKNISIEQFKHTSTKIINEGIMISGGEIKTDSIAVGKGAKIAKTAMKKHN